MDSRNVNDATFYHDVNKIDMWMAKTSKLVHKSFLLENITLNDKKSA